MKYVRGFVLSGQIISLVAFAYLTFDFFLLAYLLTANGYAMEATTYRWFGIFSLVEVPIAITGIVHSVRPYAEFKKWTPITTIVFDGLIGLLLLIGMMTPTGASTTNAITVIFTLSLFAAIALLIIGLIKGHKEMDHFHSYASQINNPNPHNPTPDDFRFDRGYMDAPGHPQAPSASPFVVPGYTPPTSKTATDLGALKKLFESQLITEEEYNTKRKEVLARDFSAKAVSQEETPEAKKDTPDNDFLAK